MTEYIFKHNKLLPLPEVSNVYAKDYRGILNGGELWEKEKKQYLDWLSTGIDLSPELKLEEGKVYKEGVDYYIDLCCVNSCDGFKCKEGKVHKIAIPVSQRNKEDNGGEKLRTIIEDLKSELRGLYVLQNEEGLQRTERYFNKGAIKVCEDLIPKLSLLAAHQNKEEEKENADHWKGEAEHWYSEAHRLQKIIDENNYVPGGKESLSSSVASHTSRSGNSIEHDDFDDEDDFEPCSKCDGHPACHDFGCAIKAGIRINGDNF